MIWSNIQYGITIIFALFALFVIGFTLVTIAKPVLILIVIGVVIGLICSALGIDLETRL